MNNPYWLIRFVQRYVKAEGWFDIIILLAALIVAIYVMVVSFI